MRDVTANKLVGKETNEQANERNKKADAFIPESLFLYKK